MISRRQLPELRAFARAEAGLPLLFSPAYSALVVPNGNDTRAVHRWFKYKEAFSADLLGKLVTDLISIDPSPPPLVLLDPFCGVGTALVSAQLLRGTHQVVAHGIDCNPLSAFIARAKTSWPLVDANRLRRLASRVLAAPTRIANELPALSSIRTGRCISRYMAARILHVRSMIESLERSPERDLLLTGLAACIEPASKIRRDGRALRIVAKPRKTLQKLLRQRWESMAQDIEELKDLHSSSASVRVYHGDGREPSALGIVDGSIDLIVTSPPYPNNIDYNEVYKLELWLLGFAGSADGFLRLRRQTFRSHPTCSSVVEEPAYLDTFSKMLRDGPLEDLLGIVARRVRCIEKGDPRGRWKVLIGYAYDTWRTLCAHSRALKPGGRAVYVLGNSLHGSSTSRPFLIPTDLLFSSLASNAGLVVERVIVARSLSRRLSGNHFLRDSVVVLRRP